MVTDSHCIEVFRELHVGCVDGPVPDLRDMLVNSAATPWHHAPEVEAKLRPSDPDYIVLDRDEDANVRGARLFLRGDADGYKVTNIIPHQSPSLDAAGYNDVLEDFLARLAGPVAKKLDIALRPTQRQQKLTDWTSPSAAGALHQFSIAANKATGASHPFDAARWRAFLIEDYRADGSLSSSNLEQWLVEVEGWPREEAQELAVERDRARELLRDYDRIR